MKLAAQAVAFALVGGAASPSSTHAARPADSASHGNTASTRAGSRPPPQAVHVNARPAPPLPMLPSVARVRVEAGLDHLVVTEEVSLPRGDWTSGGLDLYVSFGAPGTPAALDAHLVPVARGSAEPRADEVGQALTVDPAVHRSANSQLLLGRPQMAGVVVHVKEADLRRAYAESDLASLRIRSLLAAPAADSQGARDVVVRLGVYGGLALTLGRIQVASLDARSTIARAEASLCGPEADPHPLSVAVLPRAEGRASASAAIAPVLSTRHPSDDLCVRWWTR